LANCNFEHSSKMSSWLVTWLHKFGCFMDYLVNELENGSLYGHFVHPSDSKSSSIPITFSYPHAIWFVWPSIVAYGQFPHWQNEYIYFSKNKFIYKILKLYIFSIIYYDIVMWIVKLFRM
jgi:hypothetical protein